MTTEKKARPSYEELRQQWMFANERAHNAEIEARQYKEAYENLSKHTDLLRERLAEWDAIDLNKFSPVSILKVIKDERDALAAENEKLKEIIDKSGAATDLGISCPYCNAHVQNSDTEALTLRGYNKASAELKTLRYELTALRAKLEVAVEALDDFMGKYIELKKYAEENNLRNVYLREIEFAKLFDALTRLKGGGE